VHGARIINSYPLSASAFARPQTRRTLLASRLSGPIATTGPIARRLLASPAFSWHSFESRHVRVHLSSAIAASRAAALADSAEVARQAALALLGEPDISDEPRLELILVETRADMQRLVGRPASGRGFPNELTVVMVASLWRGERSDVDRRHPLGSETQAMHTEWRRTLTAVPAAVLDTPRRAAPAAESERYAPLAVFTRYGRRRDIDRSSIDQPGESIQRRDIRVAVVRAVIADHDAHLLQERGRDPPDRLVF